MLSTLLSLLVSAGPAEMTVNATPGSDIGSALQGAISACESDPPIANGHTGCIINLPAGEFYLTQPITLCRQHRIVGKGGGGWGARTVIRSRGTAFRLLRGACAGTGRGNGAAWSELEDFAILLTSTSTIVPTIGVDSQARFFARNLWVKGGTVGIRVDASMSSGGNANTFRLEGVLVESTDHAGVLIRGADTNASLLVAPNVVSACQKARQWESSLGPCAGVVDRSFLGTTIVAGHTNNAGEGTVATTRPGFLMQGDSQRSVCVGCYSERNQSPSVMARYTSVVSGLADWTGGPIGHGMRLEGPYVSTFIARNAKDAANIVEVRMGDSAASGTFFELRSDAIDAARPLRWKASGANRTYFLDIANQLRLLTFGQDGTVTWRQ